MANRRSLSSTKSRNKLRVEDFDLDEYLELTAANDPNLLALNFDGCGIGDDGLADLADALETNDKITLVDLTDNQITDEGLVALSEVLAKMGRKCNVRVLYLNNNHIGDEGLKALSRALVKTNINILMLNDNNIGVDGARYLAGMLSKSTIEEISIPHNHIGDEGCALLTAAVKANPLISWLDVKDNAINTTAAGALEAALKKNRETAAAEEEQKRQALMAARAAKAAEQKRKEEEDRTAAAAKTAKLKGTAEDFDAIMHSLDSDLPPEPTTNGKANGHGKGHGRKAARHASRAAHDNVEIDESALLLDFPAGPFADLAWDIQKLNAEVDTCLRKFKQYTAAKKNSGEHADLQNLLTRLRQSQSDLAAQLKSLKEAAAITSEFKRQTRFERISDKFRDKEITFRELIDECDEIVRGERSSAKSGTAQSERSLVTLNSLLEDVLVDLESGGISPAAFDARYGKLLSDQTGLIRKSLEKAAANAGKEGDPELERVRLSLEDFLNSLLKANRRWIKETYEPGFTGSDWHKAMLEMLAQMRNGVADVSDLFKRYRNQLEPASSLDAWEKNATEAEMRRLLEQAFKETEFGQLNRVDVSAMTREEAMRAIAELNRRNPKAFKDLRVKFVGDNSDKRIDKSRLAAAFGW